MISVLNEHAELEVRNQTPATLLLVDDNSIDRTLYKKYLARDDSMQYSFLEADTGEKGLDFLGEKIDCILLDYDLPDISGLEFLEQLSFKEKENISIIMLTAHGDEEIASQAVREGICDYLPKKLVTSTSLKRAVHNAVEKLYMKRAIGHQTHELQKKNKELIHKNDEIQRFYHTVSHELKTPLTSIKEFACIILDELAGPISSQQKEYLQLIKESCVQMTNNVNDLLDVTRLETGKYQLELKPHSIENTIKAVVTKMHVIADYKRITISTKTEANLPQVLIDPNRVEQILVNLINNAIKFTGEGGQISVTTEVSAEDSDFMEVAVTDNGCGIDKKHYNFISERLYQINPIHSLSDNNNSSAGLGLGLYLCRELVHLHNGTMKVHSKVGLGSTFSFTLPIYDKGSGVHSIIKEINHG